LTGHLVLSTLHTTTASGSIVRLLDMGLEPFLINASLELILAQRLVRRICGNCRESYKIDEAICKELRLKPEEARGTFYRGRGCEACLGTGYRGRVAIAEVLPLRPKIKEALIKGANEHAIREIARSEGMPSLRENGIKKVLEGSTTVDEVLRVTSGEQDMELKW
jgi:type II secretory ATPase GspE/PulE/Tfp pilus assembly ATPase PilB-like protein